MSITDTSQSIPRECGWNDIYGRPILTHEYLDQLRDEDAQERKKHFIAAQRGGQEHILAANADIMITGGSRGGPLPINTRVVTPRGYKRIKDLHIGDIISGADGKPQIVMSKDYLGYLPCYEFTFEDGAKVVSSIDHNWNVRTSENDNEPWVTKSTFETVQMWLHGDTSIYIPVCKPIEVERDLQDEQSYGFLGNINDRTEYVNTLTASHVLEVSTKGDLYLRDIHPDCLEDTRALVTSLGGLAYIENDGRIRIKRTATCRRLVNCRHLGNYDCCCIGVSNLDHLFLVEDFIVTHNSKSYSILLDGIKDIIHPNFNAVILRHEKPDLENIIKDSKNVYSDYGYYVSSDRDMLWRLNAGGQIQFSYHAGDIDDFKVRFQGKQYSYIAVDEITHIDWDKFLYLLTTLRNAYGIRNRFVGSCNPDKSSWVRQFIDWWIGNVDTIYADGQKHPELAGYPIPERDGKVRYCFMAGAAHLSDIIWGDTREEVYEKCKDKIAELWTEDMHRFGDPKDLFIMSVAFVEAKITDNIKLLESDPSYIARLANQSQEQIMRDLRGNWDADHGSDEYLSEEDMQRFFANTRQFGDGIPRASLDVAFEGGDAAWMWLRVGNHIQDFVEFHMDAQNLIQAVDDQLHRWHVQPQNFTFDTNGIGQAFKGFFKRAVPFNNMEAPFGRDTEAQRQAKLEYDNLKSQTAFMFADEIKSGNISIEPYLLDRRITAKGIDNMSLREILMSQRRIIAIDQKKADNYKGKCIISKDAMKKMLHYSPDAMESLLYSHVFFVKAVRPIINRPTGAASYNFSTQRGGTIGYQPRGHAHIASRSRVRYC